MYKDKENKIRTKDIILWKIFIICHLNFDLYLFFFSLSAIAVLWALFFIGAYKVSQFEREFAEYDPYAVLELDRVSNCKRIEMKKVYK